MKRRVEMVPVALRPDGLAARGHPPRRRCRAITRAEVLVMVVFAVFAFALLMTFMSRWQSEDSGCENNLRQVGLAFRVFAIDNDDRFPYRAETNSLGATNAAYMNEADAWLHFQAMKEALGTAHVLACPDDSLRMTNRADNFNTGVVATATSLARRTNAAVSYFVGLDADETMPTSVLTGDRIVSRGWSAGRSAIFPLTNNPAWTTLHGTNGHITLADGSAMVMWLHASTPPPSPVSFTGATNRLLMPFPPP